jgi:hypothetical protein
MTIAMVVGLMVLALPITVMGGAFARQYEVYNTSMHHENRCTARTQIRHLDALADAAVPGSEQQEFYTIRAQAARAKLLRTSMQDGEPDEANVAASGGDGNGGDGGGGGGSGGGGAGNEKLHSRLSHAEGRLKHLEQTLLENQKVIMAALNLTPPDVTQKSPGQNADNGAETAKPEQAVAPAPTDSKSKASVSGSSTLSNTGVGMYIRV